MNLQNVKPIPPVAAPASWDEETDVLVMGGGGGGLAAAWGAVEAGAGVTVLEKADAVGGESAMANSAVAFGSRLWQETLTKSWTEDELYHHLRSLPKSEDMAKLADPRLLKNNLVWAAYLMDGLSDMGIKWQVADVSADHPGVLRFTPVSTELTDYSAAPPFQFKFGCVIRTLERWLRGRGVEFRLGAIVTALVSDGRGRVTGVRVQAKDGGVRYFKAGAVIDSTGGFACNRDMLEHYNNVGIYAGCTTSPPTKTGDGIRMCQGMGAMVGDMTSVHGAAGGITTLKRGTGNKAWVQNFYDTPIQLLRQLGLYVNRYGLRFTNEQLTAYAAYQLLMDQPGGVIYSLFDVDWNGAKAMAEKAVFFNDGDIRKMADNPPYTPYYASSALPFGDWHEGIERAVASGVIRVADTIEELATGYGIDSRRLKRTVDEYNAGCDRGKDAPLFGKSAESLRPIRKPPFYALEHGPRIIDTRGGVTVNERGQVINGGGDAVGGLYAGSFSISGVTGRGGAIGVVGGMAFGYVAGKSAAAEVSAP
ncbi:FAD-dependent oxidoreductase [Chloroflexota bacterium]